MKPQRGDFPEVTHIRLWVVSEGKRDRKTEGQKDTGGVLGMDLIQYSLISGVKKTPIRDKFLYGK